MLNQIIEAIDEELDRLLQAREIIAAYAADMSLSPPKPRHKRKRKQRPTKEAAASLPETKVTTLPPKPEPRRQGSVLKSPRAEPREIIATYAADMSLSPPKPRHKRKRKQHPTKEAAASLPEVKVTILPPKPEPRRRGSGLKSPQTEPPAPASALCSTTGTGISHA
jgi:hypothetical protein